MFDFLKKKISEFVDNVKKTVGGKGEKEQAYAAENAKPQQVQSKTGKTGKKEKKKSKTKLTLETQIKALISKKIKLKEGDVLPALEELELALLEGDVSLEATERIKEELKQRLIGLEVEKDKIEEEIERVIRESLIEFLTQIPPYNLMEKVKELRDEKKPVIVLFVGPNGAGKTTTIAKIAYVLKQKQYLVVLAAADTFRAAAIEQLQAHGEKLGVPVIKGQYGADAAAVAYDAIKFAERKAYDVVLIDTAGRQETNINLIRELEKIARVSKPDIVIFVGEATGGHAVVEQIEGMLKATKKIDACILTKKDCGAKGGVVLSVIALGIPIAYFGTGQAYGSLQPFDPVEFVDALLQ